MLLTKNRIKSISLFLTFLILVQSCRVYHSDSVTLEKALVERKRVKIKTKSGKTLKFKEIIKDSNQYYGITRKDKFLIIENNISSVRLQNRTLSGILTVVSVLYVATGVVLVIMIGNFSVALADGLTPPN